MILRPRQKTFVSKCRKALKKHGNTLGVANTGFGKTVALSAIVGQEIGDTGRALIMAHRDELTRQNSATFEAVNPGLSVSLFNAERKSFRGRAVFSMIQTLSQDHNIQRMPPFDLVVVDEAHHVASDTYRKVIEHSRTLNPDVKILGVTATPERSDRRGLAETFSNVADVVTISEMVQAGHLVPPRAMVVDIGTQHQLRNVKKTANDYNQAEVEAIQNTRLHNRQIVDKWLELAKDRQTVIFCSTIQHCEDVRDAFKDAGVAAECAHGKMGTKERRSILAGFDSGAFPVLCNPMILTEGWDCPICSCVILLRISSHKSTMIQMIGRGLRKINPAKYPGVVKTDCLVLDFGISLLTHGDLNPTVKLKEDKKSNEGAEKRTKKCPDCNAEQPIQTKVCPLCGYEYKVELDEIEGYDEAAEFELIEIDLINKSPFRWVSLWGSERLTIATGFESWACVCSADGDNWYSVGGKGNKADLLAVANRVGAIASADDFMRETESSRNAKKAARWMNDPASPKQMQMVSRLGFGGAMMSKAEAGAYITFGFNRGEIEKYLGVR
jgi:DNA repair protein RadD